ncbi:MAG: NAD(P)/FAD-dependent oxidoreductase [Chloroflexi bacterium]|nr:NAD(P)/FAD-dependent oxidoreductase [Chloroflexota bacterium]
MPDYVIIGNSAGGIGAAEAIRQVDHESPLTILSDEPYVAYSRPAISEVLSRERSPDRILYRPRDFYQRLNIQAILGVSVVDIDFSAHTVHLADGREVHWDRLLLATGGAPFVPPIEGKELSGVYTFTRLADALALDQRLASGSQVVVIGGGLIGMSVSDALVKRGARVIIVELMDRVLGTMLDPEGSALAEAAARRAGVEVITGHTVQRIQGDEAGEVCGVVLDDGREFACRAVVIAIGVRPRVDLVADSPVNVERGILVNARMETNVPGVYACGDVAEAYDIIAGTSRVVPIWPAAYLGGRVAGLNMAGWPAEYPGNAPMNSLKYFGLRIISGGVQVADGDGYEVLRRGDGKRYRKVILKDDRIVGATFVGDIDRAGIILGLMRERIDVSSFKEDLVSDGFGLIHLPAELRRQWLYGEYPTLRTPGLVLNRQAATSSEVA